MTGNGSSDSPTSLSAWSKAIKEVGIPGSIAVFVVYMLGSYVPQIVKLLDILIVEQRQTREAMREHDMRSEQVLRAVERLCWVIAETDVEKDKCNAR